LPAEIFYHDSFLKIATFNINNINRRLPNLLAWLRTAKPDAVTLQELKATNADFPDSATTASLGFFSSATAAVRFLRCNRTTPAHHYG
jgi:exonuclease III